MSTGEEDEGSPRHFIRAKLNCEHFFNVRGKKVVPNMPGNSGGIFEMLSTRKGLQWIKVARDIGASLSPK